MVMIIKHSESLCKSKRPQNKSYETLVQHHSDMFVPLRMQFFRFLTKTLKAFLLQYQSDKPMVPFVSDSLEELLRSLMKVIVKEEFLEKASTSMSVTKIDIAKSKKQEKIGMVARKRKLINKDIQVAKKKKDEVTKCIEDLKTDADKLSTEEEERANLDLFTKANSFRKTILEKEKVLKDLEGKIIKMEESKKDFK